jgi:hypothetical protein
VSEPDRRAFTRLAARLDVALQWDGGTPLPAELLDLSIGGAFVRIPGGPDHAATCRFFLRERDGSREALVMRGCVVHANDDGIGLRFDEVPLGAFERLLALLLELGADAARMENELERHWRRSG